jgi:hypothetical protein
MALSMMMAQHHTEKNTRMAIAILTTGSACRSRSFKKSSDGTTATGVIGSKMHLLAQSKFALSR